MISGGDLYSVLSAMAPLYFAMLIAYFSVSRWRIFTPEQCSGVNRFVAVFAVPVLSFHFIAHNNPYAMDARFLLADTLSKLFVLAGLALWSVLRAGPGGFGLDWVITLFSVSTLPNTLVMGIPLLKAMYGEFTQSLMVQVVVLQCIVWYTLLLFLFEYRAARTLIAQSFPGHGEAAGIAGFDVDADVVSLADGCCVDHAAVASSGGGVRVRIRRSASTSVAGSTPARPSDLSGAEIYSVSSTTPGRGDLLLGLQSWCRASPRLSTGGGGGYASSDAYSLQPTPRHSGFTEVDLLGTSTPAWGRSPGGVFRAAHGSPVVTVLWDCGGQGNGTNGAAVNGSATKGSAGGKHVGIGDDDKELSFRSTTKFMTSAVNGGDDPEVAAGGGAKEMPGTLVMLRLILTMVGRKLSRNPNTYSSVLGLAWSLVSYKWGVEMPVLVKNSIKIISDAGLGMAMFSLGLFMALQPRIIACGYKMAAISMAIRFLGGSAVMSAASAAVGLHGARLHTAIVQAALPQGIVPFVFAREYGLHPDILSTGVIFGMLVSLPVTLLYYVLLGL